MTAKQTESGHQDLPKTGSGAGQSGEVGEDAKIDRDKGTAKAEAIDMAKLAEEVSALEKELVEKTKLADLAEEYREEAVRTKADFYNYRTRVERDRARDRVLAAEGTVDVLLPVLDNLDRTLEAVSDKESALYKGVAMVQRQFFSALQSLGLQIIETDCTFDPKHHEAMQVESVDDESKHGAILEVFHRGYLLGEKVLRAAQVKVGRKE